MSREAAPAHGEADLPARIGRYVVLRRLGHGAMGIVYAAFDDLLDRKVAIKILRDRGEGSRAFMRVLREAQALARLSHPNVVTVHDVDASAGRVYIAMEFVVGTTLKAWLKERPRRLPETLGVFVQAGRGLAAAHAVGLVHRDFKPENVMVGADDRVRVTDFGLACAARQGGSTLPDASESALLRAEMTATGTIVGTPAYMAPEQQAGAPADARSDIYSFCVALHEALHGERPGPSVVAPPAADVPAWLREVVLRGLQREPEARWPAMTALLAALTHDPAAARRRIVRRAAQVLGLVAVAAALTLALVGLQRAWVRERAERLAEGRLAGLDAALARAADQGDVSEAEAAFQAFVADPEHQATRALAWAWLRRGERHGQAEPDAALAAYARAYLAAHEPADVDAAMRAMARTLRDQSQGPALEQATRALRARGSDDAEVAELAFFAALRQRDIPAAAAEWSRFAADVGRGDLGAVLASLGSARSTPFHVHSLVDLGRGRPARFAALDINAEEVLLLDDGLGEVGRWRAAGVVVQVVAGTSWAAVSRGGEVTLHDLLAPGRPLWRATNVPRMFAGAAADLDRDGVRELLFSYMAPNRGFRVITGIGGPAAVDRPAHDATDQAGSDVDAILADDLDGDGRLEIFVALGAWHAFELRALRPDDAGRLSLITRRRLGRITALTVVRRGGERLLAALKDDGCAEPTLFPDPPHTGAPAGVYLFRWTGDELVDAGFVAATRRDREPVRGDHGAAAGDLDGDGRDDMLFVRADSGGVWLIGQGPEGFSPAPPIAGLTLLGLAQLDDDAEQEVLVSVSSEMRMWALGVGEEALPTLRTPQPPPRPVPEVLADPLLARRWVRADEIAALGLRSSAAASLREAVNLTADGEVKGHLLDRSAELLIADGDDEAALELDRHLVDEPRRAPAALARRWGALVRLGRYDAAYRAAEALLAHADAPAPLRAEAERLLARLRPLVDERARHELSFGAGLDPALRIVQSGALRHNLSAGTLDFALTAGSQSALEVQLLWDGGPLAVEVEVAISRLEYDTCWQIMLVDEDGRAWLGGMLCSEGGGGRLFTILRCPSFRQDPEGKRASPLASALTPLSLVARLAYFPGEGSTCSLSSPPSELKQSFAAAKEAPRGQVRLVFASMAGGDSSGIITGALRRVTIRGARVVAVAAEEPLARAARHLVAGDPLAALAAADEAPPGRERARLRLFAHDDLQDAEGLARAAAELLPDMSEEPWSEELVLLLRTRPAAAAAVRARLGPAALPVLDRMWRSVAHHHRLDPVVRDEVLTALRGVETLVPVRPVERQAQRSLLAMRASLWALVGDEARAQGDRRAALTVAAVETAEDAGLRAELHLALARQRGVEPAAALAHVHAALATSPAPELIRLRLIDDPAFAGLLAADPGRRELR